MEVKKIKAEELKDVVDAMEDRLMLVITFEDEEEELLTEAEAAKREKQEKIFLNLTVAVAVILAVAIFMILPYYLSSIVERYTSSRAVMTVFEGVIRVVIFLLYILLISRTKDIKRTFMYHGAEHKCINCVEHGMNLTVENVMKSSREHKRCGTSFLLFVMIVSILFFLFIRVPIPWLRVVIRILLLPVIAGVSYEIIRLAGNSDNPVVSLLSKPGLALQRLTTREPEEDMVEVAIRAVEAVFDWREYLRENFPGTQVLPEEEKEAVQ